MERALAEGTGKGGRVTEAARREGSRGHGGVLEAPEHAQQDPLNQGTTTVPGTWLDLLATTRQAKLFSAEWRIVAVVLATPHPVTAAFIAKRIRLAPTHARRVVRSLVAWGILRRTPESVTFQPDASRWGPPNERRGYG